MTEPEPVDPLIVLRARLDQLRMLAPEGAQLARVWYDAFKAQGFEDSQACYLTAAQLLNTPGSAP